MTPAATDVPSGIDGVTPQWLSDVVGERVTDVRVEQIALDSGFSSWLYRAHLTGDAVPDSVIVKLPAQSAAGQAMGMMGGYAREVAFYRDVAGRAPLEAPRAYAAEMWDNGADFVLVLEDMRHWDNADHLAGLTLDQARCAIEQLAGLHAWSTSQTGGLDTFPSINTPVTHDMLPAAFELGWAAYTSAPPRRSRPLSIGTRTGSPNWRRWPSRRWPSAGCCCTVTSGPTTSSSPATGSRSSIFRCRRGAVVRSTSATSPARGCRPGEGRTRRSACA